MRSNKSSVELRKGLWTEEEDTRLRCCISQFGEGKWHLVPSRAGLNRCRKSCRLRWLNYLKPDIKRGDFSSDEVDLMIRLHKLLGNRWSLIAGRLPGRTANDVKNYWNTHLLKKTVSIIKEISPKNNRSNTVVVSRPRRPRSFWSTKDDLLKTTGRVLAGGTRIQQDDYSPSSILQRDNTGINCDAFGTNYWWDNLVLHDDGNIHTCQSSFAGGSPSVEILDKEEGTTTTTTSLFCPDPDAEGGGAAAALGGVEEGLFGSSSGLIFSPDNSDFWDLLLSTTDQYHLYNQEQAAASVTMVQS